MIPSLVALAAHATRGNTESEKLPIGHIRDDHANTPHGHAHLEQVVWQILERAFRSATLRVTATRENDQLHVALHVVIPACQETAT